MDTNGDNPKRLIPGERLSGRRSYTRDFLIVLGLIGVGAAVLIWLWLTSPQPADKTPKVTRLVRVMEARRTAHRCRITAYGTSRASRDWTAIAEVRGEAKLVAAEFEPGEILPAGMLLVKIDDEEYRLARDRYQAEVDAMEQQLDELEKTKENLEEVLALQKDQLELAGKELRRIKALAERGAVTQADVEAAESAHLARLLTFTETENQLTLNPVLIARSAATRDAANAQLKMALRELSNCKITLPFDARCASKSIEQNQYVNTGERLGRFIALDSAEVVAMVEARKSAALFPNGVPGHPLMNLSAIGADSSPLHQALKLLDAEVHWGSGEPWRGKVTRLGSSMDPATQTFPVVIEVPDPYSGLIPGIRPPLVPDVFCEVTLWGMTIDDVVVLPRDSLHERPRDDLDGEMIQTVYVLDGADRSVTDGQVCFQGGKLNIREVSVLVDEGDLVVIKSGLEDGDLIVLGELSPASEEMPLDGVLVEGYPSTTSPQAEAAP